MTTHINLPAEFYTLCSKRGTIAKPVNPEPPVINIFI